MFPTDRPRLWLRVPLLQQLTLSARRQATNTPTHVRTLPIQLRIILQLNWHILHNIQIKLTSKIIGIIAL